MMERSNSKPRVVRGRSPTSRGIHGAGAPSRLALSSLLGLVGGLFFSLSAARADVRLEWAPLASMAAPTGEVSSYVVEARTAGAWARVAEVRHLLSDPHYDAARGVFALRLPEGRYRLVALDQMGNQSAPADFDLAADSCIWRTAEVTCSVPCRCTEVVEVLEEAHGELVRAGLAPAEGLDAVLSGLSVEILRAEQLVVDGHRVGGLYGVDAQGRRVVRLAPDLGAALHELFHAWERRGDHPYDHPAWESNPRLLELDQRFQDRQRRRRR